MPDYSKAPWGLFVLVEVGRVFTANAISPGELLRQLLARYTFRAGRQLSDKELRSKNIDTNININCYSYISVKTLMKGAVISAALS